MRRVIYTWFYHYFLKKMHKFCFCLILQEKRVGNFFTLFFFFLLDLYTVPSSNHILPFCHDQSQLAGLNSHCWPCSQPELPADKASRCHGNCCLEQSLTPAEDEDSQHFCICRRVLGMILAVDESSVYVWVKTYSKIAISTLYYGVKTF